MLNVSRVYFVCGECLSSCAPRRVLRPACDALILGTTEAENIRIEKPSWHNPIPHPENKIGFVSPWQGKFSFELFIQGTEYTVPRCLFGSADTEEESCRLAREKWNEAEAELEKFKDPRFALDYLVKTYDKYSDFSDDYRVYAAGELKRRQIQKLCKELGLSVSEVLA